MIAYDRETSLVSNIDKIPLSGDTVARRISSCIANVSEQISHDAASCVQ